MSDLKVSLVLQLKNLLGRGIGQIRGDLRGLKSEVQGLSSTRGPNAAGLDRYGRSAREAALAMRQLKREQAILGAGKPAGGAAGNTVLAGAGRAAIALGGYYGVRGAVRATVGQSISFEKAMASVRKKVDAPDEAGFQRLEETINRIATDYGLARAQVAELTAEAGASGIAFQDLERFMRMTA
ncbi:MAG TPA: phage tail tape measure protein, partial [Rhabdaerophilum sp.]|nr:phage tail tape measure protein [Rhabdaerophilum sp.]